MEKILEIQGLSKQYRGFRLSEVSFGLEPGFVMGLIGPNGEGKNTTIKLIMNLVNRDSGTIRVSGRDNLASETEIKSRIGAVFDEPSFFPDVTLSDHRRGPGYPVSQHCRRSSPRPLGFETRRVFASLATSRFDPLRQFLP